MKRAIRLIFVILILFAFSVPVMADEFREDQTISEDRNCDGLLVFENVNLTIDSDVEITPIPVFVLKSKSILTIGNNGFLTGENLLFDPDRKAKIFIEGDGRILLSFMYSDDADKFAEVLERSEINYSRDGNRIMAPCQHDKVSLVSAYVCDDCGQLVSVDSNTGSALANGSLEIVCGIGGFAIGVLVTLLFCRKKKVNKNNATPED